MEPIVTQFTPVTSLIGGAVLGLGAVLLMAVRGNILGATGILSGVVAPSSMRDWSWRAILLAGMLTGPFVYLLLTGSLPDTDVPVSRSMMIIGGFIVGIGVTYGAGCTSGHGVCGIARGSQRSIVATISFMAAAIATVFVIRHVIGG